MKKVLIIFIVLAVLACGCNPGDTSGSIPNTQMPTGPVVSQPTEKPTDAPTEAPTERPTTPPPSDPPVVDPGECTAHKDGNNDGYCDDCHIYLIIYVDFYSINDLHGKLADGDNHPGVDELTTYLKNARKTDDYAIFLSAGDMWQGAAESNMTNGNIITDWMNALDFTSMTIGNHEFDWGSEYIKKNAEIAEFPFLAINIYDSKTKQRVDYCDASVIVEAGDLQIGIIGAIGDCYNSIASDKRQDVEFKKGSELTSLVKAESTRLRNLGVDFIVYVIHDGYSNSSPIESYYDTSLSSGGYVNLVFEGHTHWGYCQVDSYGVYHLQNQGDNANGISHVEIGINSVTNKFTVQKAEQISKSQYQNLADDPIVNELMQKYDDILSDAYEVLGYNCAYRNGDDLRNIVAKLYYEAGVKKWGSKYNIVLGGGSLNIRSPKKLLSGNVTYAQLQSNFPFDNPLYLCTMKGSDLKARFLNNNDYLEYSTLSVNQIKDNETYYVVADSWDALWEPNKMTVVEMYDPNVFARDLLADYVREGGLAK